jgi:hypothetical protein
MATKVQELINEVVWSLDKTKNVTGETNHILNQHVTHVLIMGSTLNSLLEWSEEQDKHHKAKVSKLDTVITHMILNKIDCSGVKTLRDHHMSMCIRYLKVNNAVYKWRVWHLIIILATSLYLK